jgi:hypothetical protein
MKTRNPVWPRQLLAMLPPVVAFVLQWTFRSSIGKFGDAVMITDAEGPVTQIGR